MSSFATFATLVNRRIVIPSERTQYVAIDRHFLFACMAPLIGRIPVDETWYAGRYPDVGEAIQQGSVAHVRDHFVRFGYFENRLPHPIAVDDGYYLQTYPDVAEAIRADLIKSAQDHFEAVGYKEGRLPYPGFSLELPDDPPTAEPK